MNYERIFEQEKNKLNNAQRQAVETIEGPVLTLAGPGTGKTQVLAVRVGEILKRQVGISPYNILCLTYTDSGAHAMRTRLRSFIGSDAYKVQICTYHTLCTQLIKQYPFYFSSQDLSPIDSLAYFELMRDFLFKMDEANPLKRFSGNLSLDYRNFYKLFSQMDEEHFQERGLHQAIDKYIQLIQQNTDNKDFFYQRGGKIGTPKKKLEEEIQRNKKLKLAISEKANFDEQMKQAGYFTFSQMILWTLEAFKKHPDLLLDLQERFQYFLVDEYQDNNNAQNELLFSLCGYWGDKANVFVVGDDDQSIFRFQGANVENIYHFKKRFPNNLTTILLDKNYRSTQEILDSAEASICHNNTRLIPEKTLISSRTTASKIGKPIISKYFNELAEEWGVAKWVQDLLKQGVSPSEIAILYTKHQHSEQLEKIFLNQAIPYELRSAPDILKNKLIEQLITVLSYLSEEATCPGSREDLLYELLHFACIGLPPLMVTEAWIKKSSSRKRKSFRAILQAVKSKDFPEYEVQDVNKLKEVSNTLEKLLSGVYNQTIQEFVENAMYKLGFVSFAHDSKERIWLLESLYTFFEFIKRETRLHPVKPLSFFIHRVQEYKLQREPIVASKVIKQSSAVNLMTIYAAKGLEFQHVFMIKNHIKNWEKKTKPANTFSLPATVFDSSYNKLEEETKYMEELRRLFYVGMTRAKDGLYISYANQNNEGKELGQSVFLSELAESDKVGVIQIETTTTPDDLALLLQPSPANKVRIRLADEQFVDDRLQQFELSASTLHRYLECPVGFYYDSILRIPRASTPEQGYGKAVHTACKKLYPDFRTKRERFLSLSAFIEEFEKELSRYRSFFTSEGYDTYIKRGKKFLPSFYNHNIESFRENRVTQVEYPIHLVIEGVPLFGILDKLVFNGNKVTIVDYKTGKYSKSLKEGTRLKPPSNTNPHGGNYWRQGAFYQLLVDNISLRRPEKKWKTDRVVFHYIEPEKKQIDRAHFEAQDFHVQDFCYTEEQLAGVLSLIKDVWRRIQAKDFLQGCEKKTCVWCTFAREHCLDISSLEMQSLAE